MMEIFVFAILLIATGAQQSQLEGPQNTVSFVGSTVNLKCSSPSKSCSGIDWQKYVHGASPITIFKGPRTILNTNVASRDRYSVDNSSGCDLVIRNVQLTDAGRFICSAIVSSNQRTKSANLIILTSQSECATNASQDNTAEGDRVRMTCEIRNTGRNRLSVVWNGVTDAPGAVQSGATVNLSHVVVASAPVVSSFTCTISFAFETTDNHGAPIVGLASNIPVTSCETPVIKVMYSVRNATLSPSLSSYTPGSVINCTANGHPSPTFKWQEMESGSTWTDIQHQLGSEFTTPNVSSKQYRCVATNVVRGRRYNAISNEILANNTGSDHNDTLTAIGLTLDTIFFGLPLWMWVAVGGGATGLILIVILVICCCVRSCPGYKCCHSENMADGKIKDEKSLDTYVYSTANPKQNVRPKEQPGPAAVAPNVPSNRPPAPLPKNTGVKDNRKAGHNHRAGYLDLKE